MMSKKEGVEVIASELQTRLDEHDKNRKDIHQCLEKGCSEKEQQVNTLEDKLIDELEAKFNAVASPLQNILCDLCQCKGDSKKLAKLIKDAKEELKVKWTCCLEKAHRTYSDVVNCFSLIFKKSNVDVTQWEDRSTVADALNKQIDDYEKNRLETQEDIHATCEWVKIQIALCRESVFECLKEWYTREDSRLQKALSEFREYGKKVKIGEAYVRQAKQCLAIKQTYKLSECGYNEITKNILFVCPKGACCQVA